jgi:hypothetical protein
MINRLHKKNLLVFTFAAKGNRVIVMAEMVIGDPDNYEELNW